MNSTAFAQQNQKMIGVWHVRLSVLRFMDLIAKYSFHCHLLARFLSGGSTSCTEFEDLQFPLCVFQLILRNWQTST